MPRFVVLKHDSPRGLHWDFMLQEDQHLATWALEQPPDADGPLAARRLFDHRLVYLDYEGPVSGDRGTVARWDQGLYETRGRSKDQWDLLLAGQRLIGELTLRTDSDDESAWQFIFRPLV